MRSEAEVKRLMIAAAKKDLIHVRRMQKEAAWLYEKGDNSGAGSILMYSIRMLLDAAVEDYERELARSSEWAASPATEEKEPHER